MDEPSDDRLRQIYAETSTIAVVGASSDPYKAANRIPAYLQRNGFRIIPVSPKGGELFDENVVSTLADIDVPVDVVDVFRPSEEAPDIARAAVALGAKVLWLQQGVSSDEARSIAEGAGLMFVQDMCMGDTHLRLGIEPK